MKDNFIAVKIDAVYQTKELKALFRLSGNIDKAGDIVKNSFPRCYLFQKRR